MYQRYCIYPRFALFSLRSKDKRLNPVTPSASRPFRPGRQPYSARQRKYRRQSPPNPTGGFRATLVSDVYVKVNPRSWPQASAFTAGGKAARAEDTPLFRRVVALPSSHTRGTPQTHSVSFRRQIFLFESQALMVWVGIESAEEMTRESVPNIARLHQTSNIKIIKKVLSRPASVSVLLTPSLRNWRSYRT